MNFNTEGIALQQFEHGSPAFRLTDSLNRYSTNRVAPSWNDSLLPENPETQVSAGPSYTTAPRQSEIQCPYLNIFD